MARIADYIVERLQAAGVDHIFTVTGRGALFLTDAVARLKTVAGISMHHEQSASFAAAAYAQYNDRLGACMVSTGCASTNAITGVLCAWQDGLPCVFVSGQNTLRETTHHTGVRLRTYGQQEADIVAIVAPITKYAVMIDDPQRIAYEVDKALHMCQTGRKGPVWIDVPLDVQSMQVEPEELERYVADDSTRPVPATTDLDKVACLLQAAERPVVLIGSGVRSAGALDAFARFLDKFPVPVTYTGSAPDTCGAAHPLAVGSIGTMGCSRAGNFALQNADFLLVLGNRLTSMTTGIDYAKFARGAKVVAVDIDPVEYDKEMVRVDQFVLADARLFLEGLTALVAGGAKADWLLRCAQWKVAFPKCEERHRAAEKVDLYYLAECLSRTLPERAAFLSDSGLAEIILPTNIEFRDGQRCLHPAAQGAMGYALPAVVGAHFASHGAPVIAVIGDGSVMMNLQELQTIRHHAIPAKIIVINNNVYAIIRKRQVDLFRSRTIGTDPSNGVSVPDFAQVAACFGLAYVSISGSADLESRLRQVFDMAGPVLCEIAGLEDQDYIQVALARNAENRLVRRPLEDQAPFLDRETFLAAMIVPPIDQ
jgi:acetolactate synthase-1/2/3 large subunit